MSPDETLNSAKIGPLCDDALAVAMSHRLRDFAHHSVDQGELRAAAVALTVTDEGFGASLPGLPEHDVWSSTPALLLTRRASDLRHHSGQWALPGGRLEPGETPEQAALREMSEEIGICLGEENILGRLDDFVTRSGFIMTPIVVWGGPALEPLPNPGEVASVHRIPLMELMRVDAPNLRQEREGVAPVLRMPIGSDYIAAPTAALLYQFREVCLMGRHTRVAHFEQPQFAWQ